MTLRTQPALAHEERAQTEPQQSTHAVQCVVDNVRGAKSAISPPSPRATAGKGASPGRCWQPGAFSLLFSSVFFKERFKSQKKLVKLPSHHLSLAPKCNDH